MTEDRGRHRDIREAIIEGLESKADVLTSHIGRGDIVFYTDRADDRIYMAEPDVLIRVNGRILIIEIELSNTPKHLLGVSTAVFFSEGAYQNKVPIDISRKSLLIVLPSEKIRKKSSGKPRQIEMVKELIKKKLDYEFIDIVTELEAHDIIVEWLNGGM